MSGTLKLSIWRGGAGAEGRWQEFGVPAGEGLTVLGALQYIREELDPGLAFRCGCRFRRCGLCALTVDGRPRMACHVQARDGQRIGPLAGLPVVRDLVVERGWVRRRALEYGISLAPREEPARPLVEPPARWRLTACNECLACLSACPRWSWERKDFAGPYFFVQLAILHLDPRDGADRAAQARALGLEECRDCRRCRCPNGVAIYRDALRTLGGWRGGDAP